MARYRKRPVVVEAFQLTSENRFRPTIWPEWFQNAFHDGLVDGSGDDLTISTKEGVMTASQGDWIIQGVKGELYPCKPDIFEITYVSEEELMKDGNSIW